MVEVGLDSSESPRITVFRLLPLPASDDRWRAWHRFLSGEVKRSPLSLHSPWGVGLVDNGFSALKERTDALQRPHLNKSVYAFIVKY